MRAFRAVALICLLVGAGLGAPPAAAAEAEPMRLRLKVAEVDVILLRADDRGEYHYQVTFRDGHIEHLSPEQFADLVYTGHRDHNRWFRLLNITSHVGIAWVALGLLGQLLFTGRMLVQWLASEKQKRSVIPVSFWWLSLGGASMLMVYFIWRRDLVGVLGQAPGWIIYLRNLRLIRRAQQTGDDGT